MFKLGVKHHLAGAALLATMMSFIQATIGSPASSAVTLGGSIVLYYLGYAGHEGGHYIVARLSGASPRFTGKSVISTPKSRMQAVNISLAGPIFGALALIFAGSVCAAFAPISLTFTSIVLIINHLIMLLPIFPDGKIILKLTNKESLT